MKKKPDESSNLYAMPSNPTINLGIYKEELSK